jgi:hypothetical protein
MVRTCSSDDVMWMSYETGKVEPGDIVTRRCTVMDPLQFEAFSRPEGKSESEYGFSD